MIKYKMLLYFIVFIFCQYNINAFKILNFYNNKNKLINIYPCDEISYKLWNTADDIISTINEIDNFKIVLHTKSLKEKNGHILCNSDKASATDFYSYDYSTDIEPVMYININNNLLLNKNTLYNVILHEFGHVMGLDHNNILGMMNYSINMIFSGITPSYIEDTNKLWFSTDDVDGIDYSYFMVKKRHCRIEGALFGNSGNYLRCLKSPWNV
jgi:hypothetical protein